MSTLPPAGIPAADIGTVVNRQAIESTRALLRPYLRLTPVIWLDAAELGLPPGQGKAGQVNTGGPGR